MNENIVTHLVIDSIPKVESSWIDILSAMLVPTIAILGLFIAYQQYQINKQRLRHETYERRLKIYKTIQVYLSEILRDGKVSLERILEFYSEASEATFLFDDSVQKKIDEIYKKSIDLNRTYRMIYNEDGSSAMPRSNRRTEIVEENSELLKWHMDELSNSKAYFSEKLGLKKV